MRGNCAMFVLTPFWCSSHMFQCGVEEIVQSQTATSMQGRGVVPQCDELGLLHCLVPVAGLLTCILRLVPQGPEQHHTSSQAKGTGSHHTPLPTKRLAQSTWGRHTNTQRKHLQAERVRSSTLSPEIHRVCGVCQWVPSRA